VLVGDRVIDESNVNLTKSKQTPSTKTRWTSARVSTSDVLMTPNNKRNGKTIFSSKLEVMEGMGFEKGCHRWK
jgi:hypothetical protein